MRAMRPFQRSLPMQLMLAREVVMQRFRPHLTAHGLTDQQWRIVRALNEVEALEIAELSRACCLHAASLSRILPKLEAGWTGVAARQQAGSAACHDFADRQGAPPVRERSRRNRRRFTLRWRKISAAARLEQIYALLDEVIGVLDKSCEAGVFSSSAVRHCGSSHRFAIGATVLRMGEFAGKVVVITGGSRGIGRGIAEAFAREGAQTVIASTSEENLSQAADIIAKTGGPRPVTAALDLRKLSGLREAACAGEEGAGPLRYPHQQCRCDKAGNYLRRHDA